MVPVSDIKCPNPLFKLAGDQNILVSSLGGRGARLPDLKKKTEDGGYVPMDFEAATVVYMPLLLPSSLA